MPLFTGPPLPDKIEVNVPDKAGKTPLISAISYEPLSYLEGLINIGADVNVQDTGGYTALHYVAKGGRVKAVELLLNHGANPDIQNKSGGTPIALACGVRRTEALSSLLHHHANPNIAYYDGETPLMVAAEQGFTPENIELLLKHGADASAQDKRGWNAIMRFSHYKNLVADYDRQIFYMLLKKTDLQQRDKDGHSMVWHATKYNGWSYDDVARALVTEGVAFDSSDLYSKYGVDIYGNYIEKYDSTPHEDYSSEDDSAESQ